MFEAVGIPLLSFAQVTCLKPSGVPILAGSPGLNGTNGATGDRGPTGEREHVDP